MRQPIDIMLSIVWAKTWSRKREGKRREKKEMIEENVMLV